MKTITLQFSTTGGLISWMVRQVTWSSFSHVDVVNGFGQLVGAQWDGVKVRQPDYQKFTHTERVSIEVTDSQFNLFWNFIGEQLGKKYDATALFGILGHHDWSSKDKWFCSELIAAALVASGILKAVVDGDRITPEMLREMIEQLAIHTVTWTKNSMVTVG